MIAQKLNTILVGTTGISASALTPELLENVSSDSPNLINIIVQLVVGIATLIKLFKKKKEVKN